MAAQLSFTKGPSFLGLLKWMAPAIISLPFKEENLRNNRCMTISYRHPMMEELHNGLDGDDLTRHASSNCRMGSSSSLGESQATLRWNR